MLTGSCSVTGEKRDLGEATYPIYDSWAEVCDDPTFGLGETKALDLLNAQVKTNAMNALRTAKTKGPTKTLLRSEAMNEIVNEMADGAHRDCLGNKPALDALIERRMADIDARMKETEEAVA